MVQEVKKKLWDCMQAETRSTPLFRAASEALSVVIFLGGCSVLAGWMLDIPALKSVSPGLVTMKANTALCFVLVGLSLWLLQIKRKGKPLCQRIALASGFLVFGIGFLTFLQYVLGRDFGIDQTLFKEASGAILTSTPGRMAFNTALNFTITGLALFLLASARKNRCLVSQVLMLPTGAITALSLVGYFYQAHPLFIGLQFSTAMALHTMVLFLAVFFGILFCRPGCGIMGTVSSDAIGGKLIRRILPVTILIPLSLGWLKLRLEMAGAISHEFGVSFAATGNLMIMALYVFILAFFLNKSDAERRKVEAKADRLMAMVESAEDGIISKSLDSTITSWNQGAARMFGYTAGEMEGTSILRLIPPDHQGEEAMILERIKRGEVVGHFETVRQRKDGQLLEVSVSASPIRDADGRIIGASKVIRDISERKRTEEKILRAAEEWRRTFDSISDMVFLMDKDYTLVRANKAVFTAFGVRPEEMLGKKCHEWMHRTGHPWPGCPFEALLKDKKTHSGEARGPQGEILWVTVSPILDAKGELQGAVHIATDITERKKIAAAVVESRDFLRNIIDSVPDPVFVKDARHRWILFNDAFCKFMGRSPGELLGKTDYEFFPKNEADVFQEKDQLVFESGISNINEEMFTDAKGVTHVIVTKKALYTDLQGQRMLVGVIRDVTEIKKIEQSLRDERAHLEDKVRDRTLELEVSNQKLKMVADDLRQVSTAKTEFLANMSHELRTPLNSIIGFSEVLFDGTFGTLNERQKKYAGNILSSGHHLLSLINEALDLSRVESGKMVLQADFFPVKSCLEEALGLTIGLFLPKRIKPSLEVRADVGEVFGDRRKIRQVVFNLLANAVKFTPEDGKIGLLARRTEGGIEIAVWDTGIGISPEDLERVFEAFSRIESAYTKETEGAGLGLTICKKIIELHGGRIWIESEGINKGATAKFTLPSKGA